MIGDPVWISAIAAIVSSLAAIGALIVSIAAHRARRRADDRAAKLEIENASLKQDWIPLHRALRYLALQSAWSRTANDPDGSSLEGRLSGELLEALSRGEVQARGRKIFANWDKMASASQPIDQKFWQYAFIQSFGEIVLHDDKRGVATTSGELPVATRLQFREVCLRKTDVLRRWVRTRDRMAINSVYYQPLIRYWKNGGVHGEEAERLRVERRVFAAIGSAE